MLKFLYPALWISQFGVDQGWSSFDDNPRLIGDADGDGKSDVIGFGNDGTYVSLSSGSNFGSSKRWVSNYAKSAGGWTSYDEYPRFVADVNGDKKADVVGFGYAGTYVSTSTGSGFTEPSIWVNNFARGAGGWSSFDLFPRCLGDVNGDGKADIIGFGARFTWISYSTGTSFSDPQNLTPEFSFNSGWKSFNDNPRWAGDVNGDGKADLIGFNSTGVWVSLSVGTGFLAPTLWSGWFGNSENAGAWTSFDQFPRFVKDVNRDGKADIVGFGLMGIYVALSNGKGFDSPMVITIKSGKGSGAGGWKTFDNHPRMIGDVSGDGVIDIVGFGILGVNVAQGQSDISTIASINLKANKANSTDCDAKCANHCKNFGSKSNCLEECKALCESAVKDCPKQPGAGSSAFFGSKANSTDCDAKCVNHCKGFGSKSNCLEECKAICESAVKDCPMQSRVESFTILKAKANTTDCDAKCANHCKNFGSNSNCLEECKTICESAVKDCPMQSGSRSSAFLGKANSTDCDAKCANHCKSFGSKSSCLEECKTICESAIKDCPMQSRVESFTTLKIKANSTDCDVKCANHCKNFGSKSNCLEECKTLCESALKDCPMQSGAGYSAFFGSKANITDCDAKCSNHCKNFGSNSNCLDECKEICESAVKDCPMQSGVEYSGIWALSFAILGVIIFAYFKRTRKATKILYPDSNEASETHYIRA